MIGMKELEVEEFLARTTERDSDTAKWQVFLYFIEHVTLQLLFILSLMLAAGLKKTEGSLGSIQFPKASGLMPLVNHTVCVWGGVGGRDSSEASSPLIPPHQPMLLI